MYTKKWFILINGRKEGPYSVQDLAKDPRFLPDTLVWSVGYHNWVEAQTVPELAKIFGLEAEEDTESNKCFGSSPVVALDQGNYDPPWFIWFILFLSLVIYFFAKL